MTVFGSIRSAAAQVASEAAHVQVADEQTLAAYAERLLLAAPVASADPAHAPLGTEADTAAFVLCLDAVNFGSGWFPHLRKLPGRSGYLTVATAFRRHVERAGVPSARQLSEMTGRDTAALFGQDADGVAGELMELFAVAWRDLGRLATEAYGGSVSAIAEAAAGSAARLVEILAVMPFYRDVSNYRGQAVPFYKRAQITAADLALAFGARGPGAFRDLDQLTIFADNLVPHVLRLDGVLEYDRGLVDRIEAGALLEAGSTEEVEIRAGAVHAVERIVDVSRKAGRACTAMGLDYVLWNRGQEPRYKGVPRHRTRTVFY